MSCNKLNAVQNGGRWDDKEKGTAEEIIPLKVDVPVKNFCKQPELCIMADGGILLTASQELKAYVAPALFDEAIASTGHGKFHYLLLFTCGICLISMIAELLGVSYLMPAAQCDFDMSSQDKGVLSAISYIGMIASSHLWGYLADTKGRRKVLLITLLLDFGCAVIGSFAHEFWLFVVFRFFNGFFICGPSAVVYVYLGEFQTMENRSRAIMWVCLFISMGVISLPALAWSIISMKFSLYLPWCVYNSWRLFVVLCGLPSLVAAILLWTCLPESPKYYFAVHEEEKALETLKYIYKMNTGKNPENYPVMELLRQASMDGSSVGGSNVVLNKGNSFSRIFRSISSQTIPLFKQPHLPNTLLCCFVQFGLCASFVSLLLWLPDLFNRLVTFNLLHPNQTETVCEVISALRQPSDVDSIHGDAQKWNNSLVINDYTAIDDSWFDDENTVIVSSNVSDETIQWITDNIQNVTDIVMDCDIFINPSVFQNTIIIGVSGAVGYLVVAQLVKYVEKKKILVFAMVLAGCAIFGMYFVHTTGEVLTLSCIFITLSGMCVSVLNSMAIEIFPTRLNAMAVCLSLMTGRLGTALGSVMLGMLLEISCTTMLFVLGTTVAFCGFLSLLLPGPKVTSL